MSGPKTIIIVFIVLTLSLSIGPIAGNTDAEDGVIEGGIDVESVPEPAAVTSGGGKLQKFRFVTSDTRLETTTSTTFVQVPDMSITFRTRRKGAFVITYSAEAYTESDGREHVVAQVDGVDAAPGEVYFEGDTDEDGDGRWARAHTFTWVKPNVPAGTHTVRMMYRSLDGKSVTMHKRTMIVRYKR